MFTISILGNEKYEFPPKQELKLKLKDMLENEVDEKYYLSEERLAIVNKNIKFANNEFIIGSSQKNASINYDGVCPTLTSAMGLGGGQTPMIPIINSIKKETIKKGETICLNSKGGRNGIEGLQPSLKDRIYDSNGIATCCATSNFFMPNYTDGLRIRKLTPKECWRLMGFDDTDFEKVAQVNSNTQLYKQAGNSIVVNVLEAILTNLLLNQKELESEK